MPTPHPTAEPSREPMPAAHGAQPWFAQARAVPHLALGHTWHQRLSPRTHTFRYGLYFLLLPMRRLQSDPSAWGDLAHNTQAPLAFFDADHGEGQGSALAWVEGLLQARGLGAPDGEIWLQTLPRMGRYAFKPVSFWYVLRSDHSLKAVLAEVNNTFGQRHVYVLHGPQLRWGQTIEADKVFHVSPFNPVQGHYRFSFVASADRIMARVQAYGQDRPPGPPGPPDLPDRFGHDATTPTLRTAWSGVPQPYSAAAARQALALHPWQSRAVMLKIHWQALALWFKRLPFYRLPAPPPHFSSDSR